MIKHGDQMNAPVHICFYHTLHIDGMQIMKKSGPLSVGKRNERAEIIRRQGKWSGERRINLQQGMNRLPSCPRQ
ncbi:hypothetical protein LR69_01764 [Geobacillus sp. BCO2]|nr:hypothetical protein LR69_01764 [Geobacillus sp. BCO2]